MRGRLSTFLPIGAALFYAFALAGCSGGNSGATEPAGAAQIYAVSVSDDGSTANMEVSFSLSDDSGAPIATATAGDVRFTVAKLVPGASSGSWQSYINTLETKDAGDPGTSPDGTTAVQATSESANTAGGVFKNNGDGTYSYKFSINFRGITSPVAVAWKPSLTHRIAMQVTGNGTNAVYDFIPDDQSATPETRSIVDNSSCSACHERLGFHGGDRVSVKYCVTCHNPGSGDANSGNTVDFNVMIHKIHRGADLPGGVYTIWGHSNRAYDFSQVVYPQDIRNCTKCHDGANALTPDGDNWKNDPTLAACTSCHDAPAGYPNFPDLTSAEIEAAHVIPLQIAAAKFKLNIGDISTSDPDADGALDVTINFSVTDPTNGDLAYDIADTSQVDLTHLSFLIGWNTKDYTNTGSGEDPAQPVSVSVTAAVNTGGNVFTVTAANAVPATATGSGVVGLQGYALADINGDGIIETGHSDRVPVKSEAKSFAITDAAAQNRREVVSAGKCDSCHGALSAHGGNRNDNTQVCVICHNANATDIEVRPGAPATGIDGKVEEAIDFKYMIHAIHAGQLDQHGFREKGIVVYGYGGSQNDFSEVALPSGIDNLKNCTRCHVKAPAVPLNANALPTTILTGADLTVPTDDTNITPTAAVCSSCHDDSLTRTHIEQNGGKFDLGVGAFTETCQLCHGEGKVVDLQVVHAAEPYTLFGKITAPSSGSGSGGEEIPPGAPGPVSAQPPGHTNRTDCSSCHS